MSERITLDNLKDRCENVNRRLEGTGRLVMVQGQNGYIDLDEYAERLDVGDRTYPHQMVRNITCGTKREVGEFLHAMMVGIDLSRLPSDVIPERAQIALGELGEAMMREGESCASYIQRAMDVLAGRVKV